MLIFLRDFFQKKQTIRALLFLLIFTWSFGFIFPALIQNSSSAFLYPLLKSSYSNVCHQQQERSFEINKFPLLVCARCTGIYFGALFTSLLLLILFYSNINHKISAINFRWVFIAAIPIIADVVFYSINIYSYSKVVAGITGLFLGSAVFIYILSVIEKTFAGSNKLNATK